VIFALADGAVNRMVCFAAVTGVIHEKILPFKLFWPVSKNTKIPTILVSPELLKLCMLFCVSEQL
jgi:hypothetical protein